MARMVLRRLGRFAQLRRCRNAWDCCQRNPIGAIFYWHLGDFRAIYEFDEDIQHQPEHLAKPLDIIDYEEIAWDDFIRNQITAYESFPFFLGIGNHETISPKTREQYIIQFADWLDAPKLREQRLRDDPFSHKLTTTTTGYKAEWISSISIIPHPINSMRAR